MAGPNEVPSVLLAFAAERAEVWLAVVVNLDFAPGRRSIRTTTFFGLNVSGCRVA